MKIILHEVGLRDGLQMESETFPTISKIQLAEDMMKAGVDIIQLGSFVNPARLPQMADIDELFEHFSETGNKTGDSILSGLVLNEKGLERGMKCGVEMFCMGVSASETHSKKNTGKSPIEAMDEIISMAKRAMSAGKLVQTSVQSAFGCGFEGNIPENRVIDMVEKYLDAGVRSISLADTAGHANPEKVERMFSTIKELDNDIKLACHFHNTYGMGMANCWAAMKSGVTYIETAFGGLGGCPFTKMPSGNVPTEDFVHLLQNMNIRTDINIEKLIGIAKYASGFFVRELPGYVYKTGIIKH